MAQSSRAAMSLATSAFGPRPSWSLRPSCRRKAEIISASGPTADCLLLEHPARKQTYRRAAVEKVERLDFHSAPSFILSLGRVSHLSGSASGPPGQYLVRDCTVSGGLDEGDRQASFTPGSRYLLFSFLKVAAVFAMHPIKDLAGRFS